MERKEIKTNEDMLEKLQKFCKENNLSIWSYKISPVINEDESSPLGYQIIITRNKANI